MSKELAQTVRSKKIAVLVAILAAFAVFATLAKDAHAQTLTNDAVVTTISHDLAIAGIDVTGVDINHPPGLASFAFPTTTELTQDNAITAVESNTLRDSRYVIAVAPATSTAQADTTHSSVLGVNFDFNSAKAARSAANADVNAAPFEVNWTSVSGANNFYGVGMHPLGASAVVNDGLYGAGLPTAATNAVVSTSASGSLISGRHQANSSTNTGRPLSPVSASYVSGHNSNSSMNIMVLALTVFFAAIVMATLQVRKANYATGNPGSTEGDKRRITERLGAPTHRLFSFFASTRTHNTAVRHGEDSDNVSTGIGEANSVMPGDEVANPFDTA